MIGLLGFSSATVAVEGGTSTGLNVDCDNKLGSKAEGKFKERLNIFDNSIELIFPPDVDVLVLKVMVLPGSFPTIRRGDCVPEGRAEGAVVELAETIVGVVATVCTLVVATVCTFVVAIDCTFVVAIDWTFVVATDWTFVVVIDCTFGGPTI